jgi:hypothetical protein
MAEPMDDGNESGRPVADDQGGAPRWVRVSLIIAAAVVLLVVVLLLLGGDHGPRRHSAPDQSVYSSPAAEQFS